MRLKKIIIAVISIFFIFPLFAETTYKIDYYGVSTEVLDKNLATMTSDLYYTQLCEIQNFQITDMREKGIDISASDKSVFNDGKL